MESLWQGYTQFFIGLAALTMPLEAVPLFLGLTRDFSPADQRRAAFIGAAAVFSALAVAQMLGEAILDVLAVSMASFQIGGGIILLLAGLGMLTSNVTSSPDARPTGGATPASIAVVPIAIPLIVGPGAMTKVIIQANEGSGWAHELISLGIEGVIALAVLLTLLGARWIGRALGAVGLTITLRVFGVLVSAIAVELISRGVLANAKVVTG
ncbi:MAG: MarC family protein [Alphaproteobacteria bacterium]